MATFSPKQLWRLFWRNAPRQLRFSRSGKVIIAIALATGFAAINTGNNLLFLVWGLVLGAIVLSGVFSEGNIRHLSAQAFGPVIGRCGEPLTIPLAVHHHGKYIASLGVSVFLRLFQPRGKPK